MFCICNQNQTDRLTTEMCWPHDRKSRLGELYQPATGWHILVWIILALPKSVWDFNFERTPDLVFYYYNALGTSKIRKPRCLVTWLFQLGSETGNIYWPLSLKFIPELAMSYYSLTLKYFEMIFEPGLPARQSKTWTMRSRLRGDTRATTKMSYFHMS